MINGKEGLNMADEKISLKDNQSFKKAYYFISGIYSDTDQLVSEYENIDEEDSEAGETSRASSDDRRIDQEYWCAMEGVHDINALLKENKVIAIPNKNYYQNASIFDRINNRLYTYNWIGVIFTRLDDGRNCRIEITSRFDTGEKQYFLLYLLSNVLGINVFDLNVNSAEESNYTVILALLFLRKLVDAYGDGLYKEYVRNAYNDYDFKGTFDIKRHIMINNPFVGKTAYSIREHSYDNNILCLTRQTLDHITDYYPELIDGYSRYASELREIMDVLEIVTPSYTMNVNYADRVSCHREITNPLYQNYEDVRKLALMILRESGQNIFDNQEEESSCLLIDISWLWEEFIAVRLLDDKCYKHLLNDSNDKGRECLEWSEDEKWYPDFIEDKGYRDRRCIIDAKYKFWEWNKDADIHQLLSYLFLSGGQMCGVIYPINVEDKGNNEFEYKLLNAYPSFYERDIKPKMYKLPLFVPASDEICSFEKYSIRMEESVKKWKEKFDYVIK